MDAPVALDAATIRRFLDLSVDLLAVSDLSSQIIEVSNSWSRLGWRPEEVVGQRLVDIIHPEDLAMALSELASIVAGNEAVAVDLRIRAKDGSYRWIQGNAIADLPAERIYMTGADIDDRKALEEQLRAQIRLEELVASVAAGMIGADPDGIDTRIEQGLGRLAAALGAEGGYFLRDGRHREDVVFVEWTASGRGRRDRDRQPLASEARQWWQERLAGGQPVQIPDVRELGPDAALVAASLAEGGVRSVLIVPLPRHRRYSGFIGLFTVERPTTFPDHVAPLLRVAGECFMAALGQVDAAVALLDARQELEHRNDALERSNEELERFAYAAAHDLKAPLARIEMALMATRTAGEATEVLLDIAQRAASRMRQLIEDLLDYAGVQARAGRAEPVELDAVLTEVLDDLAALISDAGVRVDRGPLPVVVGHRSLLRQLLQNLLTNAVKFRRDLGEPIVRVDGAEDADGVILRVSDNGIGIPAGQRDEVFAMFTRLHGDDRAPGSGIGLATCAKVVSHHGGRIWVDDGIEGGVAVHVRLPARPTHDSGR